MTTEETTEVPMVAEIDCSTNTLSYRPMTNDEIVAQQKSADEFVKWQQEREAKIAANEALKESAKAKLVAGEPLTEEEAATIVL